MNDGTEALECVNRCLQALGDTDDVETAQSLWRAMGKFMQRAKLERAGASMVSAGTPLRATGWGLPVGDARERIGW